MCQSGRPVPRTRFVSIATSVNINQGGGCGVTTDTGRVLKVVFGTGSDGEAFPVIAQDIEVPTPHSCDVM